MVHHGCGRRGSDNGPWFSSRQPWPPTSQSPPIAQLESLGVTSWPTWGCGVSRFPWTYDEQETCLLLEGDVTVTPDGGEPVRFGAGDLVDF